MTNTLLFLPGCSRVSRSSDHPLCATDPGLHQPIPRPGAALTPLPACLYVRGCPGPPERHAPGHRPQATADEAGGQPDRYLCGGGPPEHAIWRRSAITAAGPDGRWRCHGGRSPVHGRVPDEPPHAASAAACHAAYPAAAATAAADAAAPAAPPATAAADAPPADPAADAASAFPTPPPAATAAAPHAAAAATTTTAAAAAHAATATADPTHADAADAPAADAAAYPAAAAAATAAAAAASVPVFPTTSLTRYATLRGRLLLPGQPSARHPTASPLSNPGPRPSPVPGQHLLSQMEFLSRRRIE